MEKLCKNCHWTYDDKGEFQACLPIVGVCRRGSKWMQREILPAFYVEGKPTSRYDIRVSGLSTMGEELKFELPTIGEE